MCIRDRLIPSSFDDVLINTEATLAILSRAKTALFESKGEYDSRVFKTYTKKLGEVLRKGMKFFDEVSVQDSQE